MKKCCVRSLIFCAGIVLFIYNGCKTDFSDVFENPDVEPKPIYIPEPEYPELARKLEQEGTVVIRAIVEIDSTIGYAKVEISSGYSLLDNAAFDAAFRALFEPAVNDSEPVRCWIGTAFTFQLE